MPGTYSITPDEAIAAANILGEFGEDYNQIVVKMGGGVGDTNAQQGGNFKNSIDSGSDSLVAMSGQINKTLAEMKNLVSLAVNDYETTDADSSAAMNQVSARIDEIQPIL
ncbi:MAG: hypothetical protein ACRCSN_17650 [Dermatophilaceae bacterium]